MSDVIQGMETAGFIEKWLADPETVPAIVRDYNGHLRIDQINLDAVANMSELRRMIDKQRREINKLRTACDNYDNANKEIGEELNATRWELIKAQKEVEELRTIRINALPSAEAVEVKAEQLPPKVPTEWINDGMVLVPQHDWIEMQKELEGYVSAEAVQGEWIPCSEKLPNKNGIYIVTRRRSDGFECRNLTDACYFDGTGIWHDDTRVNHGRKYLADVLAWMPLPEPYREDGAE